jgi:mono/diheme cytochrome c family protein
VEPHAEPRVRVTPDFRVRAIGSALAGILLGMAACALRNPFRTNGDFVQEGRAAYQRACASCHGLDARGGGPVASSLVVAPPDLTILAAEHGGEFPRAQLIDVIVGRRELAAHGTREMPVWAERFGASGPGAVASGYARRRLEMLADYLESLQRRP